MSEHAARNVTHCPPGPRFEMDWNERRWQRRVALAEFDECDASGNKALRAACPEIYDTTRDLISAPIEA